MAKTTYTREQFIKGPEKEVQEWQDWCPEIPHEAIHETRVYIWDKLIEPYLDKENNGKEE